MNSSINVIIQESPFLDVGDGAEDSDLEKKKLKLFSDHLSFSTVKLIITIVSRASAHSRSQVRPLQFDVLFHE
jgi:hypothetical protein